MLSDDDEDTTIARMKTTKEPALTFSTLSNSERPGIVKKKSLLGNLKMKFSFRSNQSKSSSKSLKKDDKGSSSRK